jgi:hypothetical protein
MKKTTALAKVLDTLWTLMPPPLSMESKSDVRGHLLGQESVVSLDLTETLILTLLIFQSRASVISLLSPVHQQIMLHLHLITVSVTLKVSVAALLAAQGGTLAKVHLVMNSDRESLARDSRKRFCLPKVPLVDHL